MNCRLFAPALLAVATLGATATAQAPPPNVVFLFADDLGWTDISGGSTNMGNGSGYYRTPNIDRLASLGMSFDNAYTNGPNCAPTRAALMSGQHAARTGVYTVGGSNRGQSQFRLLDGAPNRTTLDASVVTLAETLKTVGYATAHFGKWHLGNDPALGPLAQGFDVNRGGTSRGSVSGGSNGHFAQANGSWNLPNLPANGIANQFMADRLTDEALAWMGSAQQPFFCYLTHFSVHTPIQAPSGDIAAFNGVPTTTYHRNQTYAGMLKNLDDNVGRIVTFLETTPDPANPGQMLIANTVVIYYSDNGGLGGYLTAGITGGQEVTHQFPLKSGKGSLYEGGVRVPLILRWDGRVAPGSVNSSPVQSVDFHPTLAALAGAALPGGQVMDGVDFSPVLLGQAPALTRPSVHWHFPAYLQASSSMGTWRTTPVSLIRTGNFKLHFYYETRTWELYDLGSDIGENTNLAGLRPDLVQSMGRDLRNWLVQTGASLPRFKNTNTQVPLPGSAAGGDTVDWQLVQTPASPPATSDHLLVSDGNGVWLFGGDTDTGPSADTWRFDGANWTRLAPATTPPARSQHAGCWDSLRGRLVVFGGEAAPPTLLADTWTFDGSTWSQVAGSGPPARGEHAMTFDRTRGRAVLFGGRAGSTLLADTWEFDGAQWLQRTPATVPPARWGHGLAFDPTTGRTLLFGGVDGSGVPLDDTWAWNGTDWTAMTPATRPTARSGFVFAWDEDRDRLVLWGGRDGTGLALADTWELDGSDWLVRDPATSPLAAGGASAAYDTGLACTILFGGRNGPRSAATWQYRSLGLAEVASFGSGCPGTSGTTQLVPRSRPWLGTRFEVEASPLPVPTTVFFVLGFSDTLFPGGSLPFSLAPFGAPGCNLLVEPAAWSSLFAVAGLARFGLTIPATPSAVGLPFFEQALVHDPGANTLQFVVTNGIRAVVGAL